MTFPVGFWNMTSMAQSTPAAVTDWVEAGMTLAMSPEYDPARDSREAMCALLDTAAARGIRVIVCDRRTYWPSLTRAGSDDAYRRGVAEAVGDFGHHPAVFGFHVGDEPGVAEFADACRAYRIQKEMAPHLSPFLNLLPWYQGVEPRVGFANWAQYLDAFVAQAQPDLLCYDCYAQMDPSQRGWEMYFTNLREFRDASRRHGIPFWTTLLSVGHFHYRCPQEDDFRWQVNTALAHGAQGLLWFFFYMREPEYNYRVAPIDEHGERTETYHWLSRVCRTFLHMHAPLMAQLTVQRVSHVGQSWGGFSGLEGSPLVKAAVAEQPLIVAEFTDAAGRPYVAVVNNSQTASTPIWLSLASEQCFHIRWNQVETPVHFNTQPGAPADYWLAPGQMELYRVEG